jgi:tetratricopeptide (TPR) repeat protein
VRRGFAAYSRGELDRAEAMFRRALPVLQEADARTAETAECLNAVARIHHDRGEYDSAHDAARRALEAVDGHPGRRAREESASALNNLGRVCLALGDFDDATKQFRLAYDKLTADGRPTLESALIELNIGSVLDARGELERAADHYRQSLATMQALGAERTCGWDA